jgi:Fe-S-cluster containining protein
MKKKLYEPCIFLRDKRCSIYGLRPESCRTYPFKKIEEFSKKLLHNNKLIIYEVPPKCPAMLKIIKSLGDTFGASIVFQQEDTECTKRLQKQLSPN